MDMVKLIARVKALGQRDFCQRSVIGNRWRGVHGLGFSLLMVKARR